MGYSAESQDAGKSKEVGNGESTDSNHSEVASYCLMYDLLHMQSPKLHAQGMRRFRGIIP